MQIEHVAIWTLDIGRLKSFYEDYFQARSGEKYVNEGKRFESYFLEFASGARLELMQRPDIPPGAASETRGYAHLAMVQAQLVQQRRDSLGQLLDGRCHILRWQFLGADFQHEVGWRTEIGGSRLET